MKQNVEEIGKLVDETVTKSSYQGIENLSCEAERNAMQNLQEISNVLWKRGMVLRMISTVAAECGAKLVDRKKRKDAMLMIGLRIDQLAKAKVFIGMDI